MSSNFKAAVEWVERASAFAFREGKLALGKIDSDYALLQHELGIHWREKDGNWEISNNSAEALLARVEESLGARELAREIASSMLFQRVKMPEAVRTFAVLEISGQLRAPPTNRRKELWLRNQLIIVLAWRVAEEFKLVMTSGDTTVIKSAANDAVQLGLANNGYHTSARAIRHLLTSNKPENVRLREEATRWMSLAQSIAEERPDISASWGMSAQTNSSAKTD